MPWLPTRMPLSVLPSAVYAKRSREFHRKICRGIIRWMIWLAMCAGSVGASSSHSRSLIVLKPNQRPRLLAEGQQLGREYGKEAALTQIGLTETGRAVQFFRSQLAQVLRSSENPRILDSDDVRVRQLIDQFLDEVLYAVLQGYEEHITPAVTESYSRPTPSD